MKHLIFLLCALCIFVLAAHASTNPVNADNICRHMEVLSSDAFMGREAATEGEKKTIQYIAEQYESMGLEPAVGDSYFQEVRLSKYNVIAPPRIRLNTGHATYELEHKRDFLLASNYAKEHIRIEDAPLVFAGFGIHAPEIGWDDYKHVDVRGKVVIVLSDAPAEYTLDSTLWKGDPAAELYGKSFYKKNEAAKRGAIGLLTIFKQSQQGLYTWEGIADYVGVNDLVIRREAHEVQLKFSGVVEPTVVKRLFEWAEHANLDYQKAALQSDFKPIDLGMRASFSFTNTWENITTYNVAGLIRGSDLADEVVIYSAHWDHVGILPNAPGDSIRNGAIDNASGTAAIIEIARAYKNRERPCRRSILFLATTAEEKGLLGAIWYNAHPIFPLGKTVANFNMDAHYPYGKTSHILGVVYGRSDLDKYLEAAARMQQRTIVPNTAQNIAADIFFRSDHFPFAEAGIPTEFAVGAGEAVGHDNEAYQAKMAAYRYKYHQPSDEYEADFNCEGIAQDAELVMRAAWMMDRDGAFPQWHAEQPFAKYREAARYRTTSFRDVTKSHTPMMSTQGRTMDAHPADIDQDGDLDIIATGEWSYNLVLINDGHGRFSDETLQRLPLKRHDSEDIAIADFDGDGDLDLVFVSEDDRINEFYLNDGRGFFEDHSYRLPTEGKSNAVLAIDVNADGSPDLLIGNDGPNVCLINDGHGYFTERADRIPQSAKTTQDLEAGDIDGDGDLDIVCGNEDDNAIWINNGQGFFRDETQQRIVLAQAAWETREADLGDVDGDGDLDLFLANVNFQQTKDAQNRLFLNDGKGHFTDVTTRQLPGEKMHSVDGDFVDLDADGDLDIITANGFGHSFACYINNGTGTYKRPTKDLLPAAVRGDGIDIEAADYNGDGKIDLYLCNFRGSDMLLFGR